MAATEATQDSGREDFASLYGTIGASAVAYQDQVLEWQRKAIDMLFVGLSMYQAGVAAALRALDIQATLLRAFDLSAMRAAPERAQQPRGHEEDEHPHDRRSQSMVINFPDRRAA